MTKIEQAAALIDEKNSQDPHIELAEGKEYPKELLYSLRMVQKLLQFKPDASEELQIAARAQHICRWMSPREQYPMDRVGYLKWREDLKKMHADITAKILEKVGYSADFIDRVSFLIKKKLIKKDEGTQTLEDVICLVFLENYLEEFAAKHPDEKIVDILQKTWGKMSEEGHEAALKLPLTAHSLSLIKKALA
ncbi:MAG: DUF4202 domain-containing protein [Leeuwenhoekiella sp.]